MVFQGLPEFPGFVGHSVVALPTENILVQFPFLWHEIHFAISYLLLLIRAFHNYFAMFLLEASFNLA